MKDYMDEDLANALIDEYDCPFGMGGDECTLGFKCDINQLNEKCIHYQENKSLLKRG